MYMKRFKRNTGGDVFKEGGGRGLPMNLSAQRVGLVVAGCDAVRRRISNQKRGERGGESREKKGRMTKRMKYFMMGGGHGSGTKYRMATPQILRG